MTEHEFDCRVEAAAERWEQRIEGAADRLDKAVTRKWARRSFRILMRFMSFMFETGLVISAGFLYHAGHKTWASICFWLGIIGLLCDLFRLLFLRRK